MAFGLPVTRISTAPQKHAPEYESLKAFLLFVMAAAISVGGFSLLYSDFIFTAAPSGIRWVSYGSATTLNKATALPFAAAARQVQPCRLVADPHARRLPFPDRG